MSYYVVKQGKTPGIYFNWTSCQNQVKGFSGAIYKKFPTISEARQFLTSSTTTPSATTTTTILSPLLTTKPTHNPATPTQTLTPTTSTTSTPTTPTTLMSVLTGNVQVAGVIVDDNITAFSPQSNTTKLSRDDSQMVTIFTDGSCKMFSNGSRQAGFGYYIPSRDRRVSMPLTRPPYTNNRAELLAIITAVQEFPPKTSLDININIVTDSRYSILIFTGTGVKYRKNNYLDSKRQVVPNKDLIIEALQLLQDYSLKFTYIAAHTGFSDELSLGNSIADQLAVNGADKSILLFS